MRASIIIIGDEILLGQVTDINSGNIARLLGPMGWQIVSTQIVGDNGADITDAIDRALDKSDLVITTGGLGPTKDDITKHVLTDYFGGELQIDPSVSENIESVFAKRGLTLNEYTRNQAFVPTSCLVIQNVLGTAPIMWFERDGKLLISMPGVPFETIGMMHGAVLKHISDHFNADQQLLHHTLVITGITESALAEKLAVWEDALPVGVHLAYLPVPGYIRLRLDSIGVAQDVFNKKVDELKMLTGELLLHDGDATPAEILLEKLRERGLTVSTAESCTGGNIAHCITAVAGSSDCYLGSVVSYANSVKTGVLGVDAMTLAKEGAVSRPVVRQMAEGVALVIGADCSVATSGIAGPGGGTPDKPVGTVWMAAHMPGRTVTQYRRFPGDRARVIERATTEALIMLIGLLNE